MSRGNYYAGEGIVSPVPTLAEVVAMAGPEQRSVARRRPVPNAAAEVLYRPEYAPRWQVELTTAARDAIEFEVRRYLPGSGRETGGWLLGRRNTADRIPVRAATGLAIDSTRDVGRLGRRLGDGESRARQYGLDFLGSWHSHPDGSTELSEADMRACAGTLDSIRSSDGDHATRYVELLVTPMQGGWGCPRITPYVFTYRRDGSVLCERAEVKRP